MTVFVKSQKPVKGKKGEGRVIKEIHCASKQVLIDTWIKTYNDQRQLRKHREVVVAMTEEK